MSFACTNSKYQAYYPGYEYLPTCNGTIDIKKDFQYVIGAIVKDLNDWMTESALQEYHESYGSSNVRDTIEKVASAMTSGDIQKKFVERLPIDYFGIDEDRMSILKSLINKLM